jgi:hypothetical protein
MSVPIALAYLSPAVMQLSGPLQRETDAKSRQWMQYFFRSIKRNAREDRIQNEILKMELEFRSC